MAAVDSPPAANADGNTPADDNTDTQISRHREIPIPHQPSAACESLCNSFGLHILPHRFPTAYRNGDDRRPRRRSLHPRRSGKANRDRIFHPNRALERPRNDRPLRSPLRAAHRSAPRRHHPMRRPRRVRRQRDPREQNRRRRCVQVSFARTTSSGVDISDRYASHWFGCTDMGQTTQLAGHGEHIIGTFGRQGMNNDAIGLVIDSANRRPLPHKRAAKLCLLPMPIINRTACPFPTMLRPLKSRAWRSNSSPRGIIAGLCGVPDFNGPEVAAHRLSALA